MSNASDQIVQRFQRFQPLSTADRDYLASLVDEAVPVDSRRTILSDGRPCDRLHVLVAGWAAEYRILPSGGRQILKILLPGDVFGAECLMYGTALHAVQSLCRASVASIDRDGWASLQRHHPRLVRAIHLMAIADRAILGEWATSLGRRPAWERIAHLLLEIAERRAMAGSACGRRAFPLTQQDLADCTGLTIAYVNRVLGDMRRRGLIDLRNQELTIENEADLARCAGFRAGYLHPGPRSPAFGGTALRPAGPGAADRRQELPVVA